MVAAVKETDTVAVMRANKEAAIPLIEREAVGKPKILSIKGFSSSRTTGILTASTPEQITLVKKTGYYMVGEDLAIRNAEGAVLKVDNSYWTLEKGQVIDPSGHPIVGDYDGLGAFPLDSPAA